MPQAELPHDNSASVIPTRALRLHIAWRRVPLFRPLSRITLACVLAMAALLGACKSEKPARSKASPPPHPIQPAQKIAGPRLAIILDDLGNDRAAGDAIFALSCPITLSVLPNHPHSAEIAAEARRRGYEVMLHLPMQSIGNQTPEPQELKPGMPVQDVAAMLDNLLLAVPGAAGVNNHQGSQSTADAALMDELMPALRQHNLFYVDSRTTAATIAYDTAQRLGVRSAFRNVPFLDDVPEVVPVRKQLELALRKARDKGEAIAIGHPHPATLEALKEVLPEAKSQGIQLVFASQVVR